MAHLEGHVSVEAALAAGRRTIQSVLVSEVAKKDKLEPALAEARRRGVPVRTVPEATLDQIAHGRSHGGIVAICTERGPDPESSLEPVLRGPEPPFLLLLEGVDDPRNFGWTLRTAEAMGAHAVLLKRKNWDLDETAVMRASSGAFDRLPVVRIEEEFVERLRARGLAIWACVPRAKKSIYDADFRKPAVVCVGGEKRGLSGALREDCTGFVAIPTKPGATSLSMSHAAAIVLAEVRRQRGA